MKNITAALGAASTLAIAAAQLSTAEAAVIQGRITEGSGTIGLEGATITIAETGQNVTADRDGRFRFANVPAGDYTLVASYIGAVPTESTVSIASDDETATVDIAVGAFLEISDNILVVGQRGSLNASLSRQRASDRVITVLSADAIGQLPDENVAEAARRAPGVNIQNDQGEGRFVSIRGANPNFVTTTINGIRIPSPESDNRQVPLDVIDSDILSGIVITKSLTPDVDGDSIGGNVEIETLSGLDQDNMLFRLKAAGIYANQVEELGHRYSGVFANKFLEDRLGVAASVAWQKREFGSENVEVDGAEWLFEDGAAYPGELEFRDYVITRERLSASLNLDYRANDNTLLFLRGLYSDFSDQEFRSRVETKFGDPDFDRAENGVAFVDGSLDDPLEVDRDIKDRLEEQTIYSISGGGEFTKDAWTIDFTAAYSFAEEAEPDRLDTAFRSDTDLDSGFEGVFGVDRRDGILPSLVFPDADAEAAYFNPDAYGFDGLELTNGLSEDEEWSFAGNAQYDIGDFFGGPGYVKTGFKARLREKSFDLDLQVFDGFDGDDLVLSQFANSLEFELAPLGTVPDGPAIRDFFFANRDLFELDDIATAIESTGANYVAEEDVFAGYIMGQRDFGSVSVIAGVRVEHTEYDASGFSVLEQSIELEEAGDVTGNAEDFISDPALGGDLVAEDLDVEFDAGDNLTVIEGSRVFSQAVSASNSYTDWLPSANLRWDATDEVVMRLGYYRSIVRPNLEAAAPRTLIEQGEDDEVQGEVGNPDLERQSAHNFDASLEWYRSNNSVISVGAFYKDISDFIATTVEAGNFNGVDFDQAFTFVNVPDASIFGFEFNYQQPLDFLPSPLDGLIVTANYTFVDSDATLSDGREISVPGQSDQVVTGILGYDKGPFDIRVAATYRDEFVDELSLTEDVDGSDLDRIVDDHIQIDVSAKYRLTDQFKLFTEFKNINNEPFVATVRSGEFGRLNSQFEEYGWTAKFGIQFTY